MDQNICNKTTFFCFIFKKSRHIDISLANKKMEEIARYNLESCSPLTLLFIEFT